MARAETHGQINVHPSPAPENGQVTVTYTAGPGPLYVHVPGSEEVIEVPLDDNGQATIEVPTGAGKSFTVSDFGIPNPVDINVRVVGS